MLENNDIIVRSGRSYLKTYNTRIRHHQNEENNKRATEKVKNREKKEFVQGEKAVRRGHREEKLQFTAVLRLQTITIKSKN